MTDKDNSDFETSTLCDPMLAQPRLKQGLFSAETGIFMRIEKGANAGHVYTLSAGGVYLIGRKGADISLDDKKISRKHAEIGLYGPGGCTLRDLASTNGTWINGKRVTDRVKLQHGDLIRVGDIVMLFSVIENSIKVS